MISSKNNTKKAKHKVKGKSLENRNLENYNLEIHLRTIPKNITLPQSSEEELFIHLHKSNLKGNKIIGDLTPMVYQGYPIYFRYTEDTFDEEYKKQYPTFFLDKDAPMNLKNKYYGMHSSFEESFIHGIFKKSTYCIRNSLSFEEYLENYKFLKGKYLENFYIEPTEYLKIQLVEKLGLEETKKQLKKLADSPISFYGLLFGLLNEERLPYNPLPIEKRISNEEEVEQILEMIKKLKI